MGKKKKPQKKLVRQKEPKKRTFKFSAIIIGVAIMLIAGYLQFTRHQNSASPMTIAKSIDDYERAYSNLSQKSPTTAKFYQWYAANRIRVKITNEDATGLHLSLIDHYQTRQPFGVALCMPNYSCYIIREGQIANASYNSRRQTIFVQQKPCSDLVKALALNHEVEHVYNERNRIYFKDLEAEELSVHLSTGQIVNEVTNGAYKQAVIKQLQYIMQNSRDIDQAIEPSAIKEIESETNLIDLKEIGTSHALYIADVFADLYVLPEKKAEFLHLVAVKLKLNIPERF